MSDYARDIERWGTAANARARTYRRKPVYTYRNNAVLMGNAIHTAILDDIGNLSTEPLEFLVDCNDKSRFLRLSSLNMDTIRTKAMLLPHGGTFTVKASGVYSASVKKSASREPSFTISEGVVLIATMVKMKPSVWKFKAMKFKEV